MTLPGTPPPIPENGPPSDAADIAGTLVWIALLAAWVLHHRWAARSASSGLVGSELCQRCHGRVPEAYSALPDVKPALCSSCRTLARGAYAVGAGLFLSMGAFFLFFVVVVISDVIRRGGSTEEAGLVVVGVVFGGVCAGVGLAILVARRRLV